MKRVVFIALILLSTLVLCAQKYKHEVKVSCGDALMTSVFLSLTSWNDEKNNVVLYVNVSFSYFYRPLKWFWVGGNFVNFVGGKISYHWREYYPNGHYKDFSKSKLKYCAVIAPEIRFSYFNRKNAILYSALSGGVGLVDGYDSKWQKYPKVVSYFHITCFGFSCNFGKNNNIFLGGELGLGMKGFGNIHAGYRF